MILSFSLNGWTRYTSIDVVSRCEGAGCDGASVAGEAGGAPEVDADIYSARRGG